MAGLDWKEEAAGGEGGIESCLSLYMYFCTMWYVCRYFLD